ncbi:aspartate/glutamate racemase family protein [Roseicyclus persicicus]|uniref:Aspartate/glutamate racemase family protein n=1 Tax=Roseicyclus persicicus TaxID=2650661 RepID=A0A7X6JXV8_9RHOB|nr:amino acid racemase [Roseibacterium persicicum]NKX43784.1 aspartate/glutamate racemase family protein [Roseibacterium persicicum]
MRTVGILGGMGPEATVLLMQKVIAAVPARDDADHVSMIVDQNSQVPSRIARLIEGTGADPAPVLVAMARRLEAAGAQALAMPCNTAHHYARDIRGAVAIPFLDMVAAAARAARAAAGPGARVGLLASPAVAKVGLFDRALAAEGLTVVHPEDGPALLSAIRAIKATGPDEAARGALRAASRALLDKGAAIQLIACTEFSLIPEAVAAGVTAIDTLDVLVSEIVGFATASG